MARFGDTAVEGVGSSKTSVSDGNFSDAFLITSGLANTTSDRFKWMAFGDLLAAVLISGVSSGDIAWRLIDGSFGIMPFSWNKASFMGAWF